MSADADESGTEEAATESGESQPVVSLQDVSVHFEQKGELGPFGQPQTVQAVDGVSLDIHEQDVVALVGESGCGKTTLGKTMIGLQRPTEGSVAYRGQDIWDAKAGKPGTKIPYKHIRRALQIIHQDPGSALNPNRTVMGTLSEPLKKWQPQLDAGNRRERILKLLETVGVTPPQDYASRYPHQLSGGEQQRIALVRALLMNPDLILADEAVSALDVSLRVETMDLLLDLQDMFGTSYVFISHNLSNARYLAQKSDGRIGVMYLGELVEIGPPEQIINDPQHPYTKVLKWATPNLDPEEITEDEDLPMRSIDIPDPIDPPSGCRFHTRCPEAREACTEEHPELLDLDEAGRHESRCFRSYDDSHPYWESEELAD